MALSGRRRRESIFYGYAMEAAPLCPVESRHVLTAARQCAEIERFARRSHLRLNAMFVDLPTPILSRQDGRRLIERDGIVALLDIINEAETVDYVPDRFEFDDEDDEAGPARNNDEARFAPDIFVIVATRSVLTHPDTRYDGAGFIEDVGGAIIDLSDRNGLPRFRGRLDRHMGAWRSYCRAQSLYRGRSLGALNGYFQCGVVPYGYDRSWDQKATIGYSTLEPNNERAPIIQELFATYLATRSLTRAYERFQELAPLDDQDSWAESRVRRVLKNKCYVGWVQFGDIIAPGKHAPLVDAHTFNRAQVMLQGNAKTSPNQFLAPPSGNGLPVFKPKKN